MKFVFRKVYVELEKHLSSPEISLVLGPRQAGKTTILRKLQSELERKGEATVFLNIDVVEDRQFFESQHNLLEYIERKIGKKKGFVFIDEISRLENAGLFLKGLYDMNLGYKFIVTGSGSLELKADMIEPLTGRKKVFYCMPLSFTEFAAFKLKVPDDQVINRLTAQPLLCQRIVDLYLNFGGYPRVILTEKMEDEERFELLQEIFTSYLEKDIGLLLGVENIYAFQNLVKILASQVGNLVNKSELASTLGVTEKTVDKYLFLLEKTFVISLVRPFWENARKELVKSPKVYFMDLGFLHMARGILPDIGKQINGGVFENACFLRLKEMETKLKTIKPVRFWRTKSGAEVDFVFTSIKSSKPVPIEIKVAGKRNLGRSLISFIGKYKPVEGFIYFQNGKEKGEESFEGVDIHFLPYHVLPTLMENA